MKKLISVARKLVLKGDAYLDKNGLKNFHLGAQKLLSRSQVESSYNYQDLVEASFSSSFPLYQNFGAFEFSDLPLTLARGQNCFLDLYFWRRRPTVIHNHHFTGAFMCLEGANMDLEFSFKKTRRLGKFHDLGQILKKDSRIIKKGDIVPIDLLDRFIHQNHHQAELTVNLCFRTPELPGSHISNYLYSGLRYEKDPSLLRRQDLLHKFCALDDFDFRSLNLTEDDAIQFLVQMHGSSTSNVRLLRLKKHLEKLVKVNLGISIEKLMREHEDQMDELMGNYD